MSRKAYNKIARALSELLETIKLENTNNEHEARAKAAETADKISFTVDRKH